MKKNINPLGSNEKAKFDGLKKRLSTGTLVPSEFLKELRAELGDELYDSTYTSWRGLKERAKKLHAADGIPLSPTFQKFHSFVACMGLRPSRLYTLDRVNGALGYTPANCQWADKKTQTRNRAITVYATDRNGRCETLAKWAEITGESLKTLSKRRSSGWSDIDIIHGRTPPSANTKSPAPYRPYGSFANVDYSPSGKQWPPNTKSGWELALASCSTWDREDKVTAYHYVEKHRASYIQREADYVESIFDPDETWKPSEPEQVKLSFLSERIKYFTDWLRLAKRAMFPEKFVPPKDIW